MKKILITGALGQDGLILSKIYLKNNFQVFGFIKEDYKKKIRIKNVVYKINNLKKKTKIIKHLKLIKPDIIIHLASSNNTYSIRSVKKSYKADYSNNLKCTKNLLESIIEKGLKPKFIFAGSSLMFENVKKNIVSEKDNFKSHSYYGRYKIEAYKYIMSLKRKYKLDAVTAILFNHDSIYRKKNFLFPKLVNAFKKKDFNYIKNIYKLNINGDFSHAEDICNGIYKLSLYKKRVDKIILSSGKRFYINKIIRYLEKLNNMKISEKIIKNNTKLKLIGKNLLAKKIINYRITKDQFLVCNEICKYYS